MGYYHTCGRYAGLSQDTKMCAACRRDWRPAAPAPADLGYHGQPHASARSAGQSADLQLCESHITFPQVKREEQDNSGQASGAL